MNAPDLKVSLYGTKAKLSFPPDESVQYWEAERQITGDVAGPVVRLTLNGFGDYPKLNLDGKLEWVDKYQVPQISGAMDYRVRGCRDSALGPWSEWKSVVLPGRTPYTPPRIADATIYIAHKGGITRATLTGTGSLLIGKTIELPKVTHLCRFGHWLLAGDYEATRAELQLDGSVKVIPTGTLWVVNPVDMSVVSTLNDDRFANVNMIRPHGTLAIVTAQKSTTNYGAVLFVNLSNERKPFIEGQYIDSMIGDPQDAIASDDMLYVGANSKQLIVVANIAVPQNTYTVAISESESCGEAPTRFELDGSLLQAWNDNGTLILTDTTFPTALRWIGSYGWKAGINNVFASARNRSITIGLSFTTSTLTWLDTSDPRNIHRAHSLSDPWFEEGEALKIIGNRVLTGGPLGISLVRPASLAMLASAPPSSLSVIEHLDGFTGVTAIV